jgi:hypothetical protein
MAEIGKIWGKEPGDLAEFNQVDTGTIGKIYGVDFSQSIKIPVGSIVPFRGAGSIPTGWSQFTVAQGDFIIGAGSSYAVGDNGAGSGDINLSHTVAGTHVGNLPRYGRNSGLSGTNSQGNHGHTTMTFSGPMPYYQQTRLIKASSEQDDLPQDACLLKHSSGGWIGLTRLAPSLNRHFRCDSADSTGGVLTNSVVSSSNGGHNHGTTAGTLPAGDDNNASEAIIDYGAHQHSFSATLTFNLYRLMLSAWYNASGVYNLNGSNFIVMYENLTPPDGWALCDGNNGTPDMRDQFIELPFSDSDAGNSDGTGNVVCTTQTDTSVTHRHYSRQCNSCPNAFTRHTDYLGAHYHVCNHDAVWLPPYYALAFIMYTG